MAATIGLVQNDIKKVYAYSTVSQLGYMFLAAASGAFAVGIFHVVTHASSRRCSSSARARVIHASSGEQDLRHMGGLAQEDPDHVLSRCCAPRSRSPAFPFTSGFFSKDAILRRGSPSRTRGCTGSA